MTWQLKQNGRGRPYLAVTYSSRNDWNEAIAAALAGAGVRRGQLACIICEPATSARAGSREGSECR
jgi:hypothetical protein